MRAERVAGSVAGRGAGQGAGRGAGRGPSYENRLLAVLCLTYGMVFWHRMTLLFNLPFIQADLALSNVQAGILVSALSLSWAISGILVGAYSERRGMRKPLLVALTVGFSLATMVAGVADGFAVMLGARLLLGAAQGPVLPIAQTAMARDSSARRLGLNMGLVQNLGSGLLGNIVAPLVVVAVAARYGWHASFIASAVPGLIAALLLLIVMRPDPPRSASRDVAAAREPWLREALGFANVPLCLAIACLMAAYLVAQLAFLPGFFLRNAGLTSGEMAMQMSVRGGAAAVVGIVVPALSDRLGRKPLLIASAVLSVVAPAWLMLPDPTILGLTISGLFMGFSVGCLTLTMAIIPSETVPPRIVVATLGLVMSLAELVGGVLAPVGAGAIADNAGSAAMFGATAALAVAAALIALAVRETRGHAAVHPQVA